MFCGSCLIRNFAEYDESRVTVNDDICATAKGYERILDMTLIPKRPTEPCMYTLSTARSSERMST